MAIIDPGINKSENYAWAKTKDMTVVLGKIVEGIYLSISVICFLIYTIKTSQRLQTNKSE